MASRLEEIALEGLRGNIELIEKLMTEKVITTCESLVSTYDLRHEFVHIRVVLELENITSLSTLVSAMKNEDMDMMTYLGKNFAILVKIFFCKAPTSTAVERTFSCMVIVKR